MSYTTKPDPSAFPLGSTHSRAMARMMLRGRAVRETSPEESALWHRLRTAHIRMMQQGCASPCRYCDHEKPPTHVKRTSLTEIVRTIGLGRKLNQDGQQ